MKNIKPVVYEQPHFEWGQPTEIQKNALKEYIAAGGSMSIYGDNGIYEKLENWLGKYYQSEYVILTNTGTSALNSAYVGIGIQRDDEVLVPTYTFLATVTPLLRLGAIPVFVDADKSTGNIDPEDMRKKITNKTKAIAVTHMWGVACDMPEIMKIAREYNLKVIEDCSHAHFTTLSNKLLGTYGDVACFSIGAKKTMTSGEGGFLLTNDSETYLRATLLGHFEVRAEEAIQRLEKNMHSKSIAKKYKGFETGFGENYRMHPYSAVMSFALLNSGEIFKLIDKRSESLRYFSEQLTSHVSLISPPKLTDEYYKGAMYGYKARVNYKSFNKDLGEIVADLKKLNVKIKLPDSSPLHKKKLFNNIAQLGLSYESNFKISDKFNGATSYFDGLVSLPTFTRGLKEDKDLIDEYIRVFREYEESLSG